MGLNESDREPCNRNAGDTGKQRRYAVNKQVLTQMRVCEGKVLSQAISRRWISTD